MKTGKYVLQIIALIVFSIITTLATLALANETLIEATTIQLRSLDTNLKPENLEVSYGYICRYHSGLFFPEAKVCGNYDLVVPVQADGTIRLPALTKADGRQGGKTDNYQVSFTVQPKGRTPQDRTYYFILSAGGEKAIQKLQDFRDVIYFGNLNGTTLNLTAERRAILGSELSQAPNANLFVSINVVTPKSNDINAPMISSPFSYGGVSFENRESQNNFAAKTDLRDAKAVEVKGGAFAFIGNPSDAKLVVRAWYSIQVNHTSQNLYSTELAVPVDANALKNNRNIDLKQVR